MIAPSTNKSSSKASYTVAYNSDSHWSVLTQRWGSIWPRVFPYCVFNVFLMLVLSYIDSSLFDITIEITPQAHNFLGLVVSFLLVSRVNIALNRYNAARDCLGQMNRNARDLVQSACVFSCDDHNSPAALWRYEVAYRTLLLLRTVMAVISYPSSNVPAWEVPELNGEEYSDVKNSLLLSPDLRNRFAASSIQGTWQETMRVPVRVAYLLRKSIHSQKDKLQHPLAYPQENRMITNSDNFMSGYYGIRKFMTTPVPFPLIQMSRTFMFLFVFTVPFVFLSDKSNVVAHAFAVFLLTYGFFGLETVAIELDDPFGTDDNDFDAMALAHGVFEDTYITIIDADGMAWAEKLKDRMTYGAASYQKALPHDNTVDTDSESERYDSKRAPLNV